MKKLAMYLALLLVVIACGVDRPDATEGDPSMTSIEPGARTTPLAPAVTENAAPSANLGGGFGPCAPGSQDNCSGQVFGTPCVSNPGLVCLPAQQAPNGGSICSCR